MRFFQVLRVVIAVGVLLGLGHLLMHQATGPDDRLYMFIYQRGNVQYLILVAAAFAFVLLYSRRRQHRQNAARFRAFERGCGNPPEALAEALQAVGRFCTDYGTAAGHARVERFHDTQSKVIPQDYRVIHFFLGSLPVLGLVGTMLGLSDALFEAFSRGFRPESVERFVAGLSTALDTTVLATACAAPLFVWTTYQIGQESDLVDQYAECLRLRFGLADIPEGGNGTYLIYAELCRLTKRIGQDAKAMFAEMLSTSAAAVRETLGEAVQNHLAEHHQNQLDTMSEVGRQVADQLNQVADSLADAARLLNQRHDELAERMTHHMGRLESTLGNRAPEEVVLRYRGNGASERGT